jgi:hypothetical protein
MGKCIIEASGTSYILTTQYPKTSWKTFSLSEKQIKFRPNNTAFRQIIKAKREMYRKYRPTSFCL